VLVEDGVEVVVVGARVPVLKSRGKMMELWGRCRDRFENFN
jgi:hypothetical protein